jgi:hypothetical protein
MPETLDFDVQTEDYFIKIEWADQRSGTQRSSSAEDAGERERSQFAINRAMRTIRIMAHEVSKTISSLEKGVRPDEAEVEFGINLSAQAGALLAKASTQAQLTVKIKWTIKAPQETHLLVSDR